MAASMDKTFRTTFVLRRIISYLFENVGQLEVNALCRLKPFKLTKKTSNQLSAQSRWRNTPKLTLFVPAFAVVQAIGFSRSKPSETDKESGEKGSEVSITVITDTADRLYESNETLKLYNYLLQYKDTNSDQILWRLARATCDKGKESHDKTQMKKCIYEAFDYIKQALELNPKNFACHKWYAILLDYTGEYEGIKQRISNAYHVKEHFIKALQLNPKDATSIYSVGYWCFTFADLAWYHRNIAKALFATPPTSTYGEALDYFQKAEDVEPNFYSMNLLMLGKTYQRLGNDKMALVYLSRAKDYPVKTPDDEQAHKEAIEMMKKLGVKVSDE